MTDPIADMLTRIRNAVMVNKSEVCIPYSRLKERIAETLAKENYIDKYEVVEEGKVLKVFLKYNEKKAAISHIKRISKPGNRVYVSKNNIPEILNGYGLAVISTSSGIMTNREAREKKIGGELICEIW